MKNFSESSHTKVDFTDFEWVKFDFISDQQTSLENSIDFRGLFTS